MSTGSRTISSSPAASSTARIAATSSGCPARTAERAGGTPGLDNVHGMFLGRGPSPREDAMPALVLDAVAVTSRDMEASVRFYALLGFTFQPLEPGAQHV